MCSSLLRGRLFIPVGEIGFPLSTADEGERGGPFRAISVLCIAGFMVQSGEARFQFDRWSERASEAGSRLPFVRRLSHDSCRDGASADRRCLLSPASILQRSRRSTLSPQMWRGSDSRSVNQLSVSAALYLARYGTSLGPLQSFPCFSTTASTSGPRPSLKCLCHRETRLKMNKSGEGEGEGESDGSGRKRLAASWPSSLHRSQRSIIPPVFGRICRRRRAVAAVAACNRSDATADTFVESEDANSTHSFINLDYSHFREGTCVDLICYCLLTMLPPKFTYFLYLSLARARDSCYLDILD